MRAPRKIAAALAAAGLLASLPAQARAEEAADPHAHHHQMMMSMKRATRSTADYALPAIDLVRDDGKSVSLPAELDDGKPVVLNFIFTTCTTICPVLSQTFYGLLGIPQTCAQAAFPIRPPTWRAAPAPSPR